MRTSCSGASSPEPIQFPSYKMMGMQPTSSQVCVCVCVCVCGMDPVVLTHFYMCTIERILTGCITVWYGSCTAKDRKALRSVVRSVEFIIGRELPALQDTYHTRCLRKAGRILKDCCHPAFRLFT